MEELKKLQFPGADEASQPKLLHKELVGEKKVMIFELYKALESGKVDNFVDVLKQLCVKGAQMGREEIAELICNHFPKLLSRRNIRGDTALHVAVRSKNSNIVKVILLQYAIDKSKNDGLKDEEITRKKNEYGNTPLHEAVYSDHFGMSKISPLCLAVLTGNVQILKLLLEIQFPSDQELPQCFGKTPLHAALLERNPAMIKQILAKEQSWNMKGQLALHLACKRGHVNVVKEFLQHEWPNPNVLLNQKGQNILHVAATIGNHDVVRYLLKDRKIDQFTINQKDINGNTPLHLASINLFPKFLANLVLKEAGVPVKVNDMLHSQHQQVPPNMDLSLKDLLSTFLVVATLMVTVTFAAAFTVPGGVYGPDDPNPKIEAWKFWAINRCFGATILAICCLVLAFLTVPVAFTAAVRLAVANNSSLAIFITIIAAMYTSFILLGPFLGFFPIGIRFLIFRQVGRFVLRILIALIDYDHKPEDSSSHRANMDKDKDKDE
ncbi:protein ACCELERATED CELL DEATH 6 [Abrus precatorius]|uniref:Protein ACCELERATED CELL DEATH 6 n=1 Tax=Abrus precatorius TaxID=3816 RepID=A0A8B8L0N4_ABRPR|nr:protein ACCELERATED CELL DEATH 6 [Abrus precatorius]